MRTKTLLLTAALSAAGVATSLAQTPVTSANIVGYVNVSVPGGGKFKLIANPLDGNGGNNALTNILPTVPNGTTLYKFVNGAFTVNTFAFNRWGRGDEQLSPGEGAFIRLGGATDVNLVFVGEVRTGQRSHPIPAGFSIQSSEIPQEDGVDKLGFPAAQGDRIFKFDAATQSYSTFTFTFNRWNPSVPVLAVGESVFVNKVTAANWTRNFDPNNPTQ